MKDIILKKIVKEFDLKSNQNKITHGHFFYKAVAHIGFFGRSSLKIVRKFNNISDTKAQLRDWKSKIDYLVANYISMEKVTFKSFFRQNYYNIVYTIFHKDKNLLF